MTPKISFLILTYNSQRFVNKILGSILSQVQYKLKSGEYELIILDNDSNDGTFDNVKSFLKKNNIDFNLQERGESSVHLFHSEENLGYAKGINKIAKLAKGEILIIINPDAELINSDFEKLISEFSQNQNLAVVGLKIIGKDLKPEKTAGKFFNLFTFFLFSLGLENLIGLRYSPEKKVDVNYVSGGFVAIDREKFHELNGYDEDYFMYVEDMDLCFRAHKKGFEVQFIPYATIKHQGQGSSNRTFAIVNIYKGLQTFYKKNYGNGNFLFVKWLLAIKAISITVLGLVTGNKALAKTYQEALKTIK